jgi:hypothetical protein
MAMAETVMRERLLLRVTPRMASFRLFTGPPGEYRSVSSLPD